MSMIRSRALSAALSLALAWPAGPVVAQTRLPSLGDAASEHLDLGAELRLGQEIMRSIRADPAYLDDPVLLHYVQSLWTPLVAAARQQGHIGSETDRLFPWELFLVRDAAVNAFALPGGHIGVYLGLIAMTESADELASVLAHELTHVTQRHIARRIGSSQQSSMVSLAALLLGMLIASKAGSSDAAQAAIMGSQGAMIQGELNFSRDMEREADRIGFGLMEGAGFAAYGMAAMFEKLAQANRLNDNGSFPYLRSHPLTSARIAEARARVPDQVTAPTGTGLHAAMRVRAGALMDPTNATLRRLQQVPVEAAVGPQRLVGLYRQALASLRLNDDAAARAAVQQALAEADRPGTDPALREAVRWLGAEVQLGLGDGTAAAALLAGPDIGAGPARPALLLRAQAARAGNTPDPAAVRRSLEALQAWVAEHADDAAAWQQLSLSATALGLPLRAQRAAAEARAAAGDLAGAIDGLRAAQRGAPAGAAANEAIELQVIDARLRALTARQRALAKDEFAGSR